MDPQTSKFYDKNFKQYAKRTSGGSGPPAELLEKHIKRNSFVVDIGCGGGADIIALAKKGHNVTGIEPCNNMRKLADSVANKANVTVFIRDYSLPNLGKVPERFYDGVLCSGVLHHLNPEYHLASFGALLNLVKHEGVLVLSTRTSSTGELREEDGRIYHKIDWETLLSDDVLQHKFGLKLRPARKHEIVEKHENGLWKTFVIRAHNK